jgi:hypothetical protein
VFSTSVKQTWEIKALVREFFVAYTPSEQAG